MVARVTSRLRARLVTYATLLRVPNLFTTPPDVLLGAAIAVAAGTPADPFAVAVAAVASVLLYAGGVALNDYFDAPVDAEERPERPIPSGRVGRRLAFVLGSALLVAGTLVAFLATVTAGVVAATIAVVVLAYDGVLKGGPAGFLAMGAVRGLNVFLGTVAVAAVSTLPVWAFLVPVVVAGYITAVTFMAAEEASGSERGHVVVGVVGVVLASVAVPLVLVVVGASRLNIVVAIAITGGFLLWTGRPLAEAFADPAPETVGPAVGACVLGVVVLDAAFATLAGVLWPLLTLSFLLPSVVLSRTFDVS